MNGKKVKKWFMLQLWRIQQVSQILTLVLLGITDSLLLWKNTQWRGGVIANPYVGPVLILVTIGLVVWGFAIFWDLGLKMWREQSNVLVERNPYSKERLIAKEVFIYSLFYVPLFESLGKDDPKMAEIAQIFKKWLKKETDTDPVLLHDVREMFDYIGDDRFDLVEAARKRINE